MDETCTRMTCQVNNGISQNYQLSLSMSHVFNIDAEHRIPTDDEYISMNDKITIFVLKHIE